MTVAVKVLKPDSLRDNHNLSKRLNGTTTWQ
uniref:Uncharacterized protein n=1 Tax=Arundo donax TaxID=35708 RepID=A0A0A9EX43_ARUDO